MYNGFEWYGRTLEVREDRYAGLTGPGSYRGGLRGGRGGLGGRGSYRGAPRGYGFRGGYAGAAGGRDFSSQDLYADYPGPDGAGSYASGGGGGGGGGGGPGAGTGFSGTGSGAGCGYGGPNFQPEPSQQIMVRNVSFSFSSCLFFWTVCCERRN